MPAITELPLMTAEEFFEWANRPENEEKSYELENGKVVEMSRPNEGHGMVCGWVALLLWDYVRKIGRGRVIPNDTGFLVRKSPDSLRGPDIMLFLDDKTLDQASTKYVVDTPTLIVEVRSPNDRDSKMLKRIDQYLKGGVPMVWVVDPEDRVVTSYRLKEFPKVYDESELVSGNGVLPEFECPASDFFKMTPAK